jgi:lipopolysaccharide export LptBFGC system permease protein LptF
MSLGLCIVITLLGMVFIPASPTDTVSFTKMIIAVVFVVLAWVLFALGQGGHLTL